MDPSNQITPSQTIATHSTPRGSIRRHTPYTKTPKSRRLGHTASHLEKTPTGIPDAPCFKGLVNKTWKLYRLSPLYKFTTSPRDLKKYGVSLSVSITEDLNKNLLGTKETVKAVISLYKELKVDSSDPDSIQILLTGKTAKGVQSTLLTALMFGVEMQDSLVASNNHHFNYYPVLMMKGPIGLSRSFVDWLENKFDCRVSPLTFSSQDLAWMVAMWSGFNKERKNKPVELMYTLPQEVEGLSKITYTIDAEDCKQLWDVIHDNSSNEFLEDEVTTFMNSLQLHFHSCFKVRLSSMCLSRVGTSIAYVGSDGKIKFFTEMHVIPVLRYVTELSTHKSKIL